MSKSFFIHCCLIFTTVLAQSQSLTGVVLDQKTNLPIESAAVYFDGTSIGTSTDAAGIFKIELVNGVTSPLIISILGYQKTVVSTYDSHKFYRILMMEDLNTLDEILISADDGMSRELKLQHFRKEFLGRTENGASCKIMNESDLIFRFDSKDNTLTASGRKPIQVKNESLNYLVTFDIQDFRIDYKYVDLLQNQFTVNSVIYTGTSFYKDIDPINTKKILKNRNKVYEGSVLHFMRALSKKRLDEEDYQIFNEGFKVPTYKFISVEPIENGTNVTVRLSQRVVILYDKKRQSVIEENQEGFIIDAYGNYAPVEKVIFGGDMGNQRIGDSLPFDYQLIESR